MTARDLPDSGETARELPIRPEDRPLLYLLLVLHAAVLIALPVAAWAFLGWAGMRVAQAPGPGWIAPAVLLAGAVAELFLLWRLARLWRRVRFRG